MGVPGGIWGQSRASDCRSFRHFALYQSSLYYDACVPIEVDLDLLLPARVLRGGHPGRVRSSAYTGPKFAGQNDELGNRFPAPPLSFSCKDLFFHRRYFFADEIPANDDVSDVT